MKRTLAIAIVAIGLLAPACASSHPRVKIQYPPTMMPESPTFTAGDNVLTNDQQLTDAR